jgi:hypothetical protein
MRHSTGVGINLRPNEPRARQFASLPFDRIYTDVAGPLAGARSALWPRSTCAVDPNVPTAYAQFRDVSVDRQIRRNMVLSIDYAGPKGINRILYRGHECECPRQYVPGQFRDDRTGLPFSTISMVQINWLAASGFNLYNVANVKFSTQRSPPLSRIGVQSSPSC